MTFEDLNGGAASRTVYPTRDAARRAFEGVVGIAANRFFRGATSLSSEFSMTRQQTGSYHFEFFTPARNTGFGKRYHQIVNGAGHVLQEFKETWGPDGLIKVKWIHGAPDDR